MISCNLNHLHLTASLCASHVHYVCVRVTAGPVIVHFWFNQVMKFMIKARKITWRGPSGTPRPAVSRIQRRRYRRTMFWKDAYSAGPVGVFLPDGPWPQEKRVPLRCTAPWNPGRSEYLWKMIQRGNRVYLWITETGVGTLDHPSTCVDDADHEDHVNTM